MIFPISFEKQDYFESWEHFPAHILLSQDPFVGSRVLSEDSVRSKVQNGIFRQVWYTDK